MVAKRRAVVASALVAMLLAACSVDVSGLGVLGAAPGRGGDASVSHDAAGVDAGAPPDESGVADVAPESAADAADARDVGPTDPCTGNGLPETTPKVCSQSASDNILITVSNKCATETLELLWVSYSCGEVSYATIAPGTRVVQGTYVTHPWRVRRLRDQALLLEIPPQTADASFSFP